MGTVSPYREGRTPSKLSSPWRISAAWLGPRWIFLDRDEGLIAKDFRLQAQSCQMISCMHPSRGNGEATGQRTSMKAIDFAPSSRTSAFEHPNLMAEPQSRVYMRVVRVTSMSFNTILRRHPGRCDSSRSTREFLASRSAHHPAAKARLVAVCHSTLLVPWVRDRLSR